MSCGKAPVDSPYQASGLLLLAPKNFSYIFAPHLRHFSPASGFSAPQLGQAFRKLAGVGPPASGVGIGDSLPGSVSTVLGFSGRKARTRLAAPNTRNTNPSCKWEEM